MAGSQVSSKCDVFSFGMLLFEILGKRCNGKGDNWFPNHVWEHFKNRKLEVIFRECGIMDKNKEKANILSKVALWCSQWSPKLRPDMDNVVLMLEEKIPVLEPPWPFLQFSDCSSHPSIFHSEVPPPRNEREEDVKYKDCDATSLISVSRYTTIEDKDKELCKKVGSDFGFLLGECSSKLVIERTSQVPDIGKEVLERLRRETAAMVAKADDIKVRLSRAETEEGKVATNSVKNWLHDVKDVEKKINAISQSIPGQHISVLMTEVTELSEKGVQFSGESLASLPPQRGMKLSVASLVGETTALMYSNVVWDWLMNDQTRLIGVYGMRGVGKTTIAMTIYNRLLKEGSCFDQVICVTVSKDASVGKLQRDIAKAVSLDLSMEEDEFEKSKLVLEALERRQNIVIIMDDIWENISLDAIGIPKPTNENGYKLVVTTRLLEVCKQMRCHQNNIIRVEPLTKTEAWELLVEKVNVEFVPEVRKIAEEAVEECAGLPLAIITIGGAMAGNNDPSEWRLALDNLRYSSEQNKDGVYKCLKFSYDRLPNEHFKKCFLYCALYPEDWKIQASELIGFWILDGLIAGRNRQHELDQGHLVLNKLKNHCLLENIDVPYNNGIWDQLIPSVKMHDLIRDMALGIASTSFMVQAGLLLTCLPNETKWGEDLERVSFMNNNIKEISVSPICPSLSSLFLSGNSFLKDLSYDFFVNMRCLKVLDLQNSDKINQLPDSISELVNLCALCLSNCRSLKRVPSLAKLVQLKMLKLDNTAIEELPEGIKMLVNLR